MGIVSNGATPQNTFTGGSATQSSPSSSQSSTSSSSKTTFQDPDPAGTQYSDGTQQGTYRDPSSGMLGTIVQDTRTGETMFVPNTSGYSQSPSGDYGGNNFVETQPNVIGMTPQTANTLIQSDNAKQYKQAADTLKERTGVEAYGADPRLFALAEDARQREIQTQVDRGELAPASGLNGETLYYNTPKLEYEQLGALDRPYSGGLSSIGSGVWDDQTSRMAKATTAYWSTFIAPTEKLLSPINKLWNETFLGEYVSGIGESIWDVGSMIGRGAVIIDLTMMPDQKAATTIANLPEFNYAKPYVGQNSAIGSLFRIVNPISTDGFGDANDWRRLGRVAFNPDVMAVESIPISVYLAGTPWGAQALQYGGIIFAGEGLKSAIENPTPRNIGKSTIQVALGFADPVIRGMNDLWTTTFTTKGNVLDYADAKTIASGALPKTSGVEETMGKFEATRQWSSVEIEADPTKIKAIHATTAPFDDTQSVTASYKRFEDQGLYVSSVGDASTHFLRTSNGKNYEFSLLPDISRMTGRPTFVVVEVSGIKRIPRGILEEPGLSGVSPWLREQAGSGDIFIPKRTEITFDSSLPRKGSSGAVMGTTTELQALIPEGSTLQRAPSSTFWGKIKGFDEFVLVNDAPVRVQRFNLMENAPEVAGKVSLVDSYPSGPGAGGAFSDLDYYLNAPTKVTPPYGGYFMLGENAASYHDLNYTKSGGSYPSSGGGSSRTYPVYDMSGPGGLSEPFPSYRPGRYIELTRSLGYGGSYPSRGGGSYPTPNMSYGPDVPSYDYPFSGGISRGTYKLKVSELDLDTPYLDLDMPKISRKSSKHGTRSRLRVGYAPSLFAIEYDIHGKKPKNFAGWETRPIPILKGRKR